MRLEDGIIRFAKPEELVAQELMVQEMARLAIDVTANEVDQALDDIASRNGVDRARLKAEVERSGLVWATYRESITQELRGMKFNQVVLQPRVSISDDEVESLYKNKAATRGSVSSLLNKYTGPRWREHNP